MGTTRIKVIDLSSEQQEIKTSRKHARLASLTKRAEKLAGVGKLKKTEKESKVANKQKESQPKVAPRPLDEKVEETQEVSPALQDTETPKTTPVSPPKKATGTHHKGAKYQKARSQVEDKTYTAKEAFELLPKTSTTSFDASVEVHLNVTDKKIKGSISFPHLKAGTKKSKRYLIFGEKKSTISDKQNIIWANEETLSDIENGKLKPGRDFDMVVASPKFMPQLIKVAKILGPKGMMPNPKDGTITEDFEKVFTTSADAAQQYKTDPQAPVIHIKIGKVSQKSDELSQNLKVLISAIGPSKITKATLTSTMGPGIKFDATTI